MDDINVYLIISPEECKIDSIKLKISKKLSTKFKIYYDVALTELTASSLKAKYTLAVSNLLVNGIIFLIKWVILR